MSLIKLFKIPTKLFKKDVITFLIIRRHDLGVINDKLHYIAIRPTASLLQIRQKLWHLLDLPDYCEEILVLKTEQDQEIPLTSFRKGNDPQHPYVLNVWLPERQELSSKMRMLTLGENQSATSDPSKTNTFEVDVRNVQQQNRDLSNRKSNRRDQIMTEYTKSDLSCKISTSTLFFKMHGKRSKDNFANLLLKIQSDLTMLSNKLSNLEDRIQL